MSTPSDLAPCHVHFVFLPEGTSDASLLRSLEDLFVEAGADSARGHVPDFRALPRPPGHSVRDKLDAVRRLDLQPDVVLVHRDADRAGRERRVQEIEAAAQDIASNARLVPVIPVRALEDWLMTDLDAIRDVTGSTLDRKGLGLPAVRRLETLADPKETLFAAFERTLTGSQRQRKRARRRFERWRTQLADWIEVTGPVTRLPSWRQLTHDIELVVRGLRSDPPVV